MRSPAPKVTLALVKELGHPILSTSVTLDDSEPLNDPDLIREHFHNAVDLILDGGLLTSEPSTVLDLTGEQPVVVRKGVGDVSWLGL